jgi:large subunit ribosomal protein L20
MPRAKNRVASRERRKKVLSQAKGFYGRRKSNLKLAKEAVQRAGQYAYEHRKDKKGDFRKLWITRINAATRIHGLSYSVFMFGLKKAGINLNRKVLADLAMNEAPAFAEIVSVVKKAA